MKTHVINLLTAFLLFLMPDLSFAQAPTLGTSSQFVLFSTIGVQPPADATDNAITIYPNPFTESLTVMLSEAVQINNADFRMYDVLGNEVMNTTLSKYLTTIKADLPAGIYFYKVISKDKTLQSGKLVSL